MMRIIILILIAVTLFGCGKKNEYRISGTIADTTMNGKHVYMYNGAEVVDSAKIADNTFKFIGIADSVVFTEITYDTHAWKTYGILALEPGEIKITLDPKNQTTAATGTTLNDALNEYTTGRITIEINLKKKYEKTQTNNALNKLQKQTQIDEINKMYFDQSKDVLIQSITKNLHNEVSALLLASNYPNTVNDTEFGQLYNKMSDTVKKNTILKNAYQNYKHNTQPTTEP